MSNTEHQPIASVPEFLAHALELEAESHERYRELAECMEVHNNPEVAELFGVTRQTVALWVKAYRAEGEKALDAKPRGRPKGSGCKSLVIKKRVARPATSSPQ